MYDGVDVEENNLVPTTDVESDETWSKDSYLFHVSTFGTYMIVNWNNSLQSILTYPLGVPV